MCIDSNYKVQNISSAVLSNYIDHMGIYTFNNHDQQTFIPNGMFEMIFLIEDVFKHAHSHRPIWQNLPKIFIGGLHTKSFLLKAEQQNSSFITVRFKANTAKNFIPARLDIFKNSSVGVSEGLQLWDHRETDEFIKQLEDSGSNTKRIACIENFLIKVFTPLPKSPIDYAVNNIKNTTGLIKSSELAKRVGLSASQFRKRFNEEIGLSPHQFAKIERINSIVRLFKTRTAMSLTDMTYLMGYFDQSHFIKDIKSVMGVSPMSLKGMVS